MVPDRTEAPDMPPQATVPLGIQARAAAVAADAAGRGGISQVPDFLRRRSLIPAAHSRV